MSIVPFQRNANEQASRDFMLEDLTRSMLSPEDLDVTPLPTKEPAYRIHYPGFPDMYRDRFSRRENKYIGPQGQSGVFLPRSTESLAAWRLAPVKFIVEGEKKAACMGKWLAPANSVLGISGCWGWSKHHQLLPELQDLSGTVYIVLDGDILNPDKTIGSAATTLSKALSGCTTHIVLLPFEFGLDDWVASFPTPPTLDTFYQLPLVAPDQFREARTAMIERLGLMCTDKGSVYPNEYNGAKILADWYGGKLTSDFYGGVTFEGQQFQDDHNLELLVKLQELNPNWQKQKVANAVDIVVLRNQTNRIKDFMEALVWDGEERLSDWLPHVMNVPYIKEYREWGRKFMLGLVARIYNPGCEFHHMLVLQGAQGIGKTRFFRALPPYEDAYAEVRAREEATERARKFARGLVVVYDDLDVLTEREQGETKDFITKKVDSYRALYAQAVVNHPRKCVLCGTANTNTWQSDPTGSRRYWPITCNGSLSDRTPLKLDIFKEMRDQLFAEAIVAYKGGEQYWSDEISEIQDTLHAKSEPAIRLQAIVDNYQEYFGKVIAYRGRPIERVDYYTTLHQLSTLLQLESKDARTANAQGRAIRRLIEQVEPPVGLKFEWTNPPKEMFDLSNKGKAASLFQGAMADKPWIWRLMPAKE